MKFIATEGAPKAIGPYSQAVSDGGFVFASGQIRSTPRPGARSGGVEASVERVFDNLEAVLKAAGASLDDVVKTTVYLLRMSDFAAMNAVYARRFWKPSSARSTVAVAGAPQGGGRRDRRRGAGAGLRARTGEN